MIVAVCQGLLVLLGLWLAGLGVWMVVAPQRALDVLAMMGHTPLIHLGEMAVRIMAGLVFILAAATTRHPAAISMIGVFLIVSALALMLLPRRWHVAYSTWWAARIPVWAVRLIGPISVGMGGLLAWAAI